MDEVGSAINGIYHPRGIICQLRAPFIIRCFLFSYEPTWVDSEWGKVQSTMIASFGYLQRVCLPTKTCKLIKHVHTGVPGLTQYYELPRLLWTNNTADSYSRVSWCPNSAEFLTHQEEIPHIRNRDPRNRGCCEYHKPGFHTGFFLFLSSFFWGGGQA